MAGWLANTAAVAVVVVVPPKAAGNKLTHFHWPPLNGREFGMASKSGRGWQRENIIIKRLVNGVAQFSGTRSRWWYDNGFVGDNFGVDLIRGDRYRLRQSAWTAMGRGW